jgi:inosine-uridine nucleoside N-ribohydrolase
MREILNDLKSDRVKKVILDTDAYNEIDDQFAISYALHAPEKLNIRAFCAAPFFNSHSESPADGMERSYQEILNLLKLSKREDMIPHTYRGSTQYLPDEKTAVESEAARHLVELAKGYSPEKPLYVVAIGAITNVASALIMDPSISENIVIVWLGGSALHRTDVTEFNMKQDYAAARVIFGCGAPVVMFPCAGVVDIFRTSEWELRHWLGGKNELCDYLIKSVCDEAESYAKGKPWTRIIWDVTAISWLTDNGKFFKHRLEDNLIPQDDATYLRDSSRPIRYIYEINRDYLFEDLFNTLTQ